MTKRELTAKQQAFVQEYVRDHNATQAAVRAGYSPKTAYSIAEQLLRKLEIRQAIVEAEEPLNRAAGLASEKLRIEIARIAFSDVRKLFKPDGTLKLPHELDDETAAAVASFKVDLDGNIEYKFWDKNNAHERGAKILGMFEKDHKQQTDPLRALLAGLSGNVVGPVKLAPDADDDEE